MKTFATLYRYELRKLLTRKLLWVLAAVFTALFVLMGMTDAWFVGIKIYDEYDGTWTQYTQYDYQAPERAASRRVSGTAIDDAALRDAADVCFSAWVKENGWEDPAGDAYTILGQYVQTVYPGQDWPFCVPPLWQGMDYADWLAVREQAPLAADLYARRRSAAEIAWDAYLLPAAQKKYWQKQEDTLPTPFVWQYAQGWQKILQSVNALNIALVVLAAGGLAATFSVESERRTDQLLLAARYGRGPLYAAKWLAGASVTLAAGLLFAGITCGIAFVLYGVDGAGGVIQLSLPFVSRHLTFGQAAVAYLGLLALAALLYSALTLFLSELLQNAAAALATTAGPLLFVLFFNIDPGRGAQGTLSQMLYLLPTKIVRTGSLEDPRLVLVPGGYLTNLQAAALLYLLGTVLLALGGGVLWRRHQVKGR